MAQPDAYNRRKDFTANDGDETDHSALNTELDNAGRSINQIRDSLKQIQRDDGQLANQSVGADQLKPEAFESFRGGLDDAVRDAQAASAESTRSATASGEYSQASLSSAQAAARSETNAAASAAASAGAAQYLFNGIYLGPHTSDPLVDGNGNPPTDGDFYYNTQAKTWRAFDAETARWVAPILSGQYKRVVYTAAADDFEAGVTDTLPLPSDPQTVRNIFVHFDGVHQNDGTYSVAGLNLVFDAPIPVSVTSVEVAYIEAITIIVTDALMSFPTRAAAALAAASISDGQAWEIRADESNGGKVARGVVMAGALVSQAVTHPASTIEGLVSWQANPTGVQSMNGGQLAGMRNKIINGAFIVNQRSVSGTVTLAAGAYGHDRWKAGASGCTYTFTASKNAVTINITSGTLMQVIEWINLQVTPHVLSWVGTSKGRVDAGAYGSSGSVIGTPVASTNQTIEFSVGTLSLPQYEYGTLATPFEHRLYGVELMMCRRYGRPMPPLVLGQAFSATSTGYVADLDVLMRSVPTINTTTGFTTSGAGGGPYPVTPAIAALADAALYITGATTGMSPGYATIITAPSGAFLSAEI